MQCTSCGARGCRCAFVGEFCALCAARLQGQSPDSVPLDLRLELRQPLHFRLSATGIGDAVCGVYAGAAVADALAAQGRNAVFHTHQAHWLKRVSHHNLIIRAWDAGSDALQETMPDLNAGYEKSFTQRCRKTWYLEHLPELGALAPRAPRHVDQTVYETRTTLTNYVVLSPYSAWQAREWPAPHWGYLAHLLQECGYSVALIGSNGDGERLERDFGRVSGVRWYWGHRPEFVTDLLLGARAFVGNDSGMTHLAGLLRVSTVAVHAQLAPGLLWNATDVASAVPETKCRFCAWQQERGWRAACCGGCSALATISPERVIETMTTIIEQTGVAGAVNHASSK